MRMYILLYITQQVADIEYLRGNQLNSSGDGHHDSPGYTAKYAIDSLVPLLESTSISFRIGKEESMRQAMRETLIQTHLWTLPLT